MARWATPETIADATHGDADAVERLIAAVWPQCHRRLRQSLIAGPDLGKPFTIRLRT